MKHYRRLINKLEDRIANLEKLLTKEGKGLEIVSPKSSKIFFGDGKDQDQVIIKIGGSGQDILRNQVDSLKPKIENVVLKEGPEYFEVGIPSDGIFMRTRSPQNESITETDSIRIQRIVDWFEAHKGKKIRYKNWDIGRFLIPKELSHTYMVFAENERGEEIYFTLEAENLVLCEEKSEADLWLEKYKGKKIRRKSWGNDWFFIPEYISGYCVFGIDETGGDDNWLWDSDDCWELFEEDQ